MLHLAHRYGLRATVVRAFNIIGAGVPAGLVAGALIRRIREALQNGNSTVRLGNLHPERDFIAVDDVVDGYVRLMQVDLWGEIFNFCSGEGRSIQELAQRILAMAPRSLQIEIDPALVRPADPPRVIGCSRKAQAAFGFSCRRDWVQAIQSAWQYAMKEDARCVS
ncbi:MAG: GDP-6-deoxy-D-mannose reductase [Verrucomicrobia bacterium ADurb.Bin474]|nr:MAG: GDP-6-deoxy-D-mannose reductase [Verrucomicrobia bacterium ADurb.Bin474]